MRLIHPTTVEHVDVAALYWSDERPAPDDDRPWLALDFVASADGGTAIDGTSGSLGGDADKEVFHALRAVPDVILVGANTVRAERYGPPRPTDDVRQARAARGQTPAPRLAVISGRLDLDPTAKLFADAEPDNRPYVITAAGAEPERLAALAAVCEEVIVAGDGHADLRIALQELRHRAASVVLCEGGPTLAGQLAAADLVDELCVTIAPVLIAGDAARLAHGPAVEPPQHLRLDRVLERDGVLCLRYVRG